MARAAKDVSKVIWTLDKNHVKKNEVTMSGGKKSRNF